MPNKISRIGRTHEKSFGEYRTLRKTPTSGIRTWFFLWQNGHRQSCKRLENYQAMLCWIFVTGKCIRHVKQQHILLRWNIKIALLPKRNIFPILKWHHESSQGALYIWTKVSGFQVRYLLLHRNSSIKGYLRTKLKLRTRIWVSRWLEV